MTTTDKLGPPWDMDELTSALRAAHEDLEAGRPVVWTGPPVTWCALAAVDDVPGCFEEEALERHSGQGRGLRDVLTLAALLIGMEQGARIVNAEAPLRDLVDELDELLVDASSRSDRSRMASALDRLLEYVNRWSAEDLSRIDELFDRLDPSRLMRAVGQTLLAGTRSTPNSIARRSFLSRFVAELRTRGASAETIRLFEES